MRNAPLHAFTRISTPAFPFPRISEQANKNVTFSETFQSVAGKSINFFFSHCDHSFVISFVLFDDVSRGSNCKLLAINNITIIFSILIASTCNLNYII